MHTAHQRALDRQTITKTSDSEGTAEQSAAGVKGFSHRKIPHKWEAKIGVTRAWGFCEADSYLSPACV